MGFALAALATGCGGGSDAMNQQLSELRAQIVKVRADNAVLTDRLDSLELSRNGRSQGAQRPELVTAPPAPPASDRPALEVVRLAPENDPDRPVLRSVAGGVVVDNEPGVTPAGDNPSTPSRRRKP